MEGNAKLKHHYNKVYEGGSSNYYTFSSHEESLAILNVVGDLNGKNILEIGCGEGNLAAMLASAGGNVTAVDYSEEVIKIARSKYNIEGLKFVCDNYKNLTGKYDYIVLQGVLEHFDKPFESLDWMMENVLTPSGVIVTSSPSFLNPRGYVWMTLQLLLDVPMSLSDLHFLCPFDFEDYCEKSNRKLSYISSNQSWGVGSGMIIDFHKRLRNALSDAGFDNSKVDSLLDWLDKAKDFFKEEKHTGANIIYKIE